MKIKAAVVNKKEDKFEIQELTLAPLQPREVLVKVKAVGLCHTDLSVKAGKLPTNYPVVLGHEGSGVVDSVGDSITQFK